MKEKTFSKDAILALIGAFCYISCATMAMPITAGFTKSLGGSAELMGFMTGLMYLVSLCMRPVAGNMADKFSKAKLTIVGSGLMALSNFAYAMAPNLIVLTTARIVCGIGYAACTVSLSTWFSMLVPSNKVGKAMGIYGTMQAISMAIVGKVAVSVTNLTNERTAFVISAVFAVVTFALSFVIKDRGNPVIKEGAPKKKLRLLDLNVLPVAIILMLFTIPYNATQGLIKDYVLERNFLVDAGWFITMYAIFLIVLRVGFRNFFDKVRYRNFLFISLVSSIVSMTCLNFVNNYFFMGIAALCMAGGYGIMCSVTQATAIKLAGGKENRGVANSTYYMGFDAGMALGPTIGGIIMGNFDITLFYPILMLCSVLAFGIYLFNRKKIDNA
ncbi:MAG: MFS transporter [Clostridia bacterium]|nr:MFS transporter [Clostridia bacterium]